MTDQTDVWVSTAFAKINLGLKIIGRIPSGYHELETGFCFIEWNDQLEVSHDTATTVHSEGLEIPAGKDNLIVRAAEAFRKATGIRKHYLVHVRKNIPLGAGLGGGSADAAAMLRILNKMEQAGLNDEQLAGIGAALGADVPVMISGKTGIGTGTGTTLQFLPIQPRAWILTVYPGFESNTAEAYANCMPTGSPDISLEKILTEYNPDEWRYLIDNDLEPAVIPRFPLIGNMKDQLYDMGAVFAAMSGSGSSVFGFFEQEFVALDAYHYFVQNNYKTNITRPGFKPDTGVYRR
ncbi:MAG: 4-(cytidine 5'-diphospho)-2-C-methyl-D-erythritol kinase [Cyclonatronaceae bacterium]